MSSREETGHEETERLLASVATRELDPGARRQIVQAVLAADVGCRRRWYVRSIPLWQAAAACVAVCVTAFLAARMIPVDQPHSGRESPPFSIKAGDDVAVASTFVSLDPAVFGSRRGPVYHTDISRWKTITPPPSRPLRAPSLNTGDQTP